MSDGAKSGVWYELNQENRITHACNAMQRDRSFNNTLDPGTGKQLLMEYILDGNSHLMMAKGGRLLSEVSVV